MKEFRLLIIAIVLFFSGNLSAQVIVQGGRGSVSLKTVNLQPSEVEIVDGVAVMKYNNDVANIAGSPYLNDEFVDGTMTTLDGTVIPGLKYRYDIYGDKMQFILNGDTATINKPLALSSIELEEQKFVYDVYLVEANRVATGYFEVIEDNEYLKVLYKRAIELEQDIYVPNYGGGGGSKELRMKPVNSYYVKLAESAARKISNKKDLLKLIPQYNDQIRSYIKEKRLSVKKAADLQAIAIYFERLKETGS